VSGGLFNYSVSYTNGVVDGGSAESNVTPDAESDAKGDVSARIFFQPFQNSDAFALRGLGFGVAGTYVDSSGSASNTLLTSYKTPGQATFFNWRATTAAAGATPAVNGTFASGERLRVSPQFYYFYNSIGVLGEYATVKQDVSRTVGAVTSSDSLDIKAWQLQFSWLLTGEEQTFRSPNPAQPFQAGKPGWGAWELVARVHELSIDEDAFLGGAASYANPATAARKARAAGVGVNWYLNQNIKWQLDYDLTRFDGGAATGDRPDEKAIFTRVGLQF
jgi:phosphate-selective porin OprO/OprP